MAATGIEMDFAPFGGAPFAGTHEQHGRQLEGRHRRDVAVVAVHGARQQRDIARDTWRRLIQTYPDSAAARRAYRQLNTR